MRRPGTNQVPDGCTVGRDGVVNIRIALAPIGPRSTPLLHGLLVQALMDLAARLAGVEDDGGRP